MSDIRLQHLHKAFDGMFLGTQALQPLQNRLDDAISDAWRVVSDLEGLLSHQDLDLSACEARKINAALLRDIRAAVKVVMTRVELARKTITQEHRQRREIKA